jgi:O-antigen/teichoic acid export membrane protein
VIGFPMGLILVPLGVPAALIAFGDIWKDAGYGAMALSLLCVGGTLISFASEVLKADGRPDTLTRIRTVTLIAAVAFMVALVGFDLVGICAGFSIGTMVGASYAIARVGEQLQIGVSRLVREVLPAAVASVVMAGILTPLEFLVIDAGSHGTAVGLLLLIAEALLGLVVYLLALRVLAPESFQELIGLAGRLLRRRSGSEPDAGDAFVDERVAPEGEEAPTEASLR